MALIASLIERLWPTPKHNTLTISSAVRERNRAQWERLTRSSIAQPRDVMVQKVIKETPDTVSLYLEPSEGNPIQWQPGQFLTCCFASERLSPESGERAQKQSVTPLRRPYSISSAPTSGQCRITVKKLKEGVVSGFIHNSIKAGDHFQILGPSGDFTLPDATDNINQYLFIAAGSGITPIISQISELLTRSPDANITLIYGNRYARDIIFKKELDELARQHSNLSVHYTLSRPGKSWKGYRGRIDTALVDKVLADSNLMDTRQTEDPHARVSAPGKDCHIYLCGPHTLMETLHTHLINCGIQPALIQSEEFKAAPKSVSRHPDTPQRIYFRRSQRWVTAEPGESILEAGLKHGINLQYSCQVGGCGHCKLEVNHGDVISDEPNCLSEDELQRGQRLACLSFACSETEVEA